MLARLGKRLREAIADDGTAYRIGGDEFCVLLACAESRFDEAIKRATDALTESGRGYSIGASWGVARMPSEADSPSTTLQLADVRMYAQKESRRGAPADIAIDDPGPVGGAIKATRG
jgi:two-component system, cell cycle response regulator